MAGRKPTRRLISVLIPNMMLMDMLEAPHDCRILSVREDMNSNVLRLVLEGDSFDEVDWTTELPRRGVEWELTDSGPRITGISDKEHVSTYRDMRSPARNIETHCLVCGGVVPIEHCALYFWVKPPFMRGKAAAAHMRCEGGVTDELLRANLPWRHWIWLQMSGFWRKMRRNGRNLRFRVRNWVANR
jgi:hypothetical protein